MLTKSLAGFLTPLLVFRLKLLLVYNTAVQLPEVIADRVLEGCG
jgi:hypothetical protein